MKKSLIIGNFCYGGHSWMSDQFRDTFAQMGHKLLTSHEYPNADVKYNRKTIKNFIDSCDVIILPTRSVQPAKSANRLVLAWSRRKPVIVSPQDSYLRLVVDGENALVAQRFEDFPILIDRLANDEGLRLKLANNGFERCMMHPQGYNPVNHFKKLLSEIKRVDKQHSIPKVHVAIPHYSPRTDYLKLAVESALNSKGVDITVTVASSSKVNPEGLVVDPRLNYYHTSENMTFAAASNKAADYAPKEVDYILLLNDDAILSEHSISRMIAVSRANNDAVVNPFSNCDLGWLHNSEIKFGDKSLVPAMNIEQFTAGELDQLSKSQFSDAPTFIESPFAAFYATLIPIACWGRVGKINEEFRNGGEDADWCFRAKRMGIKVGWASNAFVFHFGGKSRKVSHEIRGYDHVLEDQHNNQHLAKRWPRNGKRIAIYTGPAWEKWDLNTPYTTGIGGSETCAIRLAEQMVRHGHSVILYGEHDNQEQDGIILRNWREFNPDQDYWDLFISSRRLDPINERLRAGKVVIWVHDIFIMNVKNITRDHLIDHYAVLSQWHKEFFESYHSGYSPDKITIIPNGLAVELFS